MRKISLAMVTLALVAAPAVYADVLADWTFENLTIPSGTTGTDFGPVATDPNVPQIFGGNASGHHAAAATTWSSPVGNGSAKSFSSNTWAIGDYYQFATSTVGYAGVTLDWDQTSSNTGPRDFVLAYSTDGTTFNTFGSQYAVLPNNSPNPVWNATTFSSIYHFTVDLSSVSALDNAATVYFRLVDNSTVSANGGTVGTNGTDRVDNFVIAAVPEPTSLLLLGLGIIGLIRRR